MMNWIPAMLTLICLIVPKTGMCNINLCLKWSKCTDCICLCQYVHFVFICIVDIDMPHSAKDGMCNINPCLKWSKCTDCICLCQYVHFVFSFIADIDMPHTLRSLIYVPCTLINFLKKILPVRSY